MVFLLLPIALPPTTLGKGYQWPARIQVKVVFVREKMTPRECFQNKNDNKKKNNNGRNPMKTAIAINKKGKKFVLVIAS
jgi:hypothetical protein